MFDNLADSEVADGGKWPEVDRQAILDVAPRVATPRDAVRFYVMACTWGVGVNQRFVTRRVRIAIGNEAAGERLLSGILLRHADSISAYEAFRSGSARLKHLGPGFFSKILYFGSWNDSPAQRPLILDQYVAAALNGVAGLGWKRTWNWTTGQYKQYLDLAAQWGNEWGTEPDVVEKTLFRHGRTLR